MDDRPFDIRVGVLLEEDLDVPDMGEDSDGHAEAIGRQRRSPRHRNRVVKLGEEALRAAAHAVGSEIAVVVAGVLGGIGQPAVARSDAVKSEPEGSPGGGVLALDTGSFSIESVELTFGVKASVGVGPAVTALLTAGGEADVEVKLTLSRRDR